LTKFNAILPKTAQLRFEDFLTIYEVIPLLISRAGEKGYEVLVSAFPELEGVKKSEEDFIRFFSEKIVPLSPRGKLSPGAMSNAPDRLDGFHTYNLCCRTKQDTGRTSENLRTYSDDRRAFEFWCEGDWAAANVLMTMGGKGVCPECGRTDLMSADHIGPISLGFSHTPWFKPLCSSCNSSKGNRLTHSDATTLIAKERQGYVVTSFQIRSLWDLCKGKVDSDASANKLSKALRINQHYFLLLLKEIYDAGHPEILLLLTKPELAEEKIEFIDVDPSDFTFKEIKRARRAETYSKSKGARMLRIAFESLDDYAAKEKRNIHAVPDEIERSLRKLVLEAVTEESNRASKSDLILSKKLNKALHTNLGPEVKIVLIEKTLGGKYRPEGAFSESIGAIKAYVDGIGAYLAANSF
jgi:Alw26I/Eco31I/Esp3I family type II restriction endonuclease